MLQFSLIEILLISLFTAILTVQSQSYGNYDKDEDFKSKWGCFVKATAIGWYTYEIPYYCKERAVGESGEALWRYKFYGDLHVKLHVDSGVYERTTSKTSTYVEKNEFSHVVGSEVYRRFRDEVTNDIIELRAYAGVERWSTWSRKKD